MKPATLAIWRAASAHIVSLRGISEGLDEDERHARPESLPDDVSGAKSMARLARTPTIIPQISRNVDGAENS